MNKDHDITFKQFCYLGGRSGLWLSFYPVLYFILSRGRELKEVNAMDLSALGFIAYAFVAFIIVCKDFKSAKTQLWKRTLTSTPLIWFLLYSILCALSCLWSVNLYMTAFRCFEAFIMMMLILSSIQNILERGDDSKLLTWTGYYTTITIFAQVALHAKRLPTLPYIMESSQMFAPVMLYAMVFSSCKTWKKWLVYFFSAVSGSTVSYIGLTLGGMSLFKKKETKPFLIIGILFLLFAIYLAGTKTVLQETLFADKKEISIENTSGRDQVMNVALGSLDEYPLGCGFFSGESYILYKSFRGAINGHNSFFSAAMGVGYPGIILMVGFFLHLIFTLVGGSIPARIKPALVGCFCVAFINSMGNPGVGSRVFGAWLPTMYIYVLISTLSAYQNHYKVKNHTISS